MEFKNLTEEKAVENVIGMMKAGKHKKAKVKLGELWGRPDEFMKLFEFLTENTSLQGAKLKIKSVPARVDCLSCDWKGDPEIKDSGVRCPRCLSDVKILSGREFQVVV